MRRVLVTGASGFIGRHTLRPLVDRGFEVHAVRRGSEAVAVDGVDWHRADLLDAEARRALMERVRPSHFLHLAWIADPKTYWTSEANLDWLAATVDLVRAFRDAGGERFVGTGTCAEYDWAHGTLSESGTPSRPASLYGASKHATSLAVRAFCQEAGLAAAWGRVFFIYGPHEPPNRLVSSVIRSLLREQAAKCSSGEQERDFSYVADVAAGLVALLDSDVEGIVNVGAGRPVAVRDVVSTIGDLMERRHLIELGVLPKKPDDPPLLVADVGRLFDVVGFRPSFDLESGLRDTIEWWKRREKASSTP